MSLSYRAALGAMWTITTSLAARSIGMVATLLITRYVTPNEYGEVAIAAVLLISVSTFSALGVSQYLISYPKAGREVAFHATTLFLGAGALAFIGVWLFRAQLGNLFDAPQVASYLPWLLLGSIVDRFAGLPTRLLVRDMRFKVLGLSQLLGEVTYAAVSLWLAVLGYGAFSLIFGGLARDVVLSSVILSQVSWREWLTPCRLQWAHFRALLRYGLPFSASASLDVVARKWDNLLFAQIFSPAAAGRYSLAYNLADVPAAHIGEHIGDVLLPSFSRMEDPADRRRALSRAAGLLALVVFPMAVGLGVVADSLIVVLFRPEWQTLAPMLTVLSVLSIVRPLGWLLASYLLADGKTGRILLLQVVKALAIVAFISMLAPFGELAACAAIGLAFGAHAATGMFLVRRTHQVPVRSLVGPMLGPLLGCIPLGLAVWLVRSALARTAGDGVPVLQLTLEITAGALAYVLGAWLLANSQMRDLLRLLVGAVRQRVAASPRHQSGDVDDVTTQ